MTTASTDRAEFLKNQYRYATAVNSTAEARWGTDADDITSASLISFLPDAQAEANRHRDFFGYVRARDRVTLAGLHTDLEGNCIGIDYAGEFGLATVTALVIESAVDLATGTTELLVEVRLV